MCRIWTVETTDARQEAKVKSTRHSGWPLAVVAGVVLLSLVSAPAQAGCNKSVTLYNAYWCPYCKQVRAILARNHIRYTILDATTLRVQAAMIRKFGDTGVPRTVIGGVVVEGVDEARIKQLCR
jgi:glutaredoxin